jgi:cytochrome P450 family 4
MTATAAAVAEPSSSATITLFFLLIPALILYFVYWKLQRRRFVELADKLPGPKGLPIVGHGFSFLGSSLRKFHSEGFRKNVAIMANVFDSKSYFLSGFKSKIL